MSKYLGKIATALVLLLLASLLFPSAVFAQPPELPMTMDGYAYIGGIRAPDGTEVEATINGQEVATCNTVTSDGQSGYYALAFSSDQGDEVHLFINDVEAEESPIPLSSWVGGQGLLPGCPLSLHVGAAPSQYTLTMQIAGQGAVTPTVGTHVYDADEVVNISAVPASGWQFSSWNGSVANAAAAATTVTMDSDKIVQAVFTQSSDGGGGGGGGGGVPTIAATLFGTSLNFRINTRGYLVDTVTATSPDGKMTIRIPSGTKCLDKNGNPLSSLIILETTPPAPPAGANIIGLAYDFGPDGATFDPPFTITWSYDPADLPEGVLEEELVIAYYDTTAGEWVELVCTVDTVNNVITASIAHFTTYAILGTPRLANLTLGSLVISPTEVTSGEEVIISLQITNSGNKEGSRLLTLFINGTKEAERSVAVAAGSTQTVSFSVTKEDAGLYNVSLEGQSGSFTVTAPETTPTTTAATTTPTTTPAATTPTTTTPTTPAATTPTTTTPTTPPPATEEGTNWPLISGIVGGVIVVSLIVILLARRRSY